jgi:hypothetical protein
MLKIHVHIRNVYGENRIYPVCDLAKGFARLIGQKTLTLDNVRDIKALGYDVQVIQPTPVSLNS